MNRANRVRLGAFVLLGVLLIIGGFLAVGIAKIFEPRIRAITVLNTSIEGLSVGSPVKYLGVSVGRVTRLAMRRNDGYVAVYFDIYPAVMDQVSSDFFSYFDSSGSDVLKEHDLHCFINAASVMGGAYLELSTTPSDAPNLPYLEVKVPPNLVYIRSVPSHIGNAIQNISRVIEGLSKVDWVQLSDKVNLALNNVNSVFGSGDLTDTLRNFNQISRQLELSARNLSSVLSEENMRKLDNTINSIDESMKGLREAARDENLRRTLDNFNGFLLDTRTFFDTTGAQLADAGQTARQLRLRLEESLTRVDNFLVELNRVLNALDDHPEQLIRGGREQSRLRQTEP